MNQIITPQVGRHVWFHQTTANVFPGSESVRAAIITHVHSDRMVNLCVFDANGVPLSRTSVLLVQPGDPKPQHMHCEWMPYQVQKAAEQGGDVPTVATAG